MSGVSEASMVAAWVTSQSVLAMVEECAVAIAAESVAAESVVVMAAAAPVRASSASKAGTEEAATAFPARSHSESECRSYRTSC